jgi:hypothetical protein
MNFRLDLDALKARADVRLDAAASPANVASPANRLMPDAPEISQLATLATSHAQNANADTLPTLAWNDADIARFEARRDRLMRWGWPDVEAERMADRLTQLAREADDRRACVDCSYFRPWACTHARRADLCGPDIGPDLASLPQRCFGFVERSRPAACLNKEKTR